mmetsp:Transcript_70458/g.166077  ORF Transcript_70458/g.166077 Transcript_70458/m.166077 type:complete len:215 (+) Transcript_70458:749-1393(+)
MVGRRHRLGELAAADAKRHLGHPGVGIVRAERTCRQYRCERGLGIAEVGLGQRALQQQLRLDARRQAGWLQARVVEHLGLLALGIQGHGQRDGDFGTVDAKTDRLAQLERRSGGLAVSQQGLAQQYMHRQLRLVDLQRVLQLDDRAGNVPLLIALQSVFIKARRLRCVLSQRDGRGGDQQGGQQAAERGGVTCHRVEPAEVSGGFLQKRPAWLQ